MKYTELPYPEGMSATGAIPATIHFHEDKKVVLVLDTEPEFDMKRLYDWLMDEGRKSANTAFTSGELRNVAREIEFRLFNKKAG